MKKDLSKIPGQKFRRQFFNIPIYLLLAIDMALLALWTAVTIQDAEITFTDWMSIASLLFLISAGVLLPLVILSLLNRFCFGEIICVLDEKGLHYDRGFIAWSDIKKAIYHPDIPGDVGTRIVCCNQLSLTVKTFQKKIQIELDGAPFSVLRQIKRHCPGIPCRISGGGIAVIIGIGFGPAVISILSALFT